MLYTDGVKLWYEDVCDEGDEKRECCICCRESFRVANITEVQVGPQYYFGKMYGKNSISITVKPSGLSLLKTKIFAVAIGEDLGNLPHVIFRDDDNRPSGLRDQHDPYEEYYERPPPSFDQSDDYNEKCTTSFTQQPLKPTAPMYNAEPVIPAQPMMTINEKSKKS
jgi:hypothetical protein